MPLSNTEQYRIELLNRARLDPLAEAERYGIDLNKGMSPGTISSDAKQPLAPNDILAKAAENHSTWMLEADVFSHTGANGSSPTDRMRDAGYDMSRGFTTGENISASSSITCETGWMLPLAELGGGKVRSSFSVAS